MLFSPSRRRGRALKTTFGADRSGGWNNNLDINRFEKLLLHRLYFLNNLICNIKRLQTIYQI